jgi:hypothetical protein
MAGFSMKTNFRTGQRGDNGFNGWSAVYALHTVDADKVVEQLIGYIGGTGVTPTAHIGEFLGENGFVTDAAFATNIKGNKGNVGNNGDNGHDGWGAVYALENVDKGNTNRTVLKVVDFTGGTGTKPTVPVNCYIGENGLTTAALAVDLLGATGKDGENAWMQVVEPFYRTPTEVVLRVVDFTGGTGTKPTLDPLANFIGAGGVLGAVSHATVINPQDSLKNRLEHIRQVGVKEGLNFSYLQNFWNKMIVDGKAWILSNTANSDFSQVDTLSVFASSIRNLAYHLKFGVGAKELATFPMSNVFPTLRGALDDWESPTGRLEIEPFMKAATLKYAVSLYRCAIDFDGEIETKWILGDVDDNDNNVESAGFEAVAHYFLASLDEPVEVAVEEEAED